MTTQKICHAQIYVLETTVIEPGYGKNIRVRHRTLLLRPDGYCISAKPQVDLALNTFGTLINGVVDGQAQPLPYTNFGQTPIKLRVGQILGILEECPTTPPTQCEIYIRLAEVFKGLLLITEQPEGKNPDSYPYLVSPTETSAPVDILKANVSDY
jgi:hypothetical protein